MRTLSPSVVRLWAAIAAATSILCAVTTAIPPDAHASGTELCGVWTQAAGPQPVPRDFASYVLDPVRHRIVGFGGILQDVPNIYGNDVWTFSLDTHTWAQLSPTGTPPVGRYRTAGVYDPVRDRILIIGGMWGQIGPTTIVDVYALSLSGTPTWTQLTPTGTPPLHRDGLAVAYDPVGDRVLMFGGTFTGAGGGPVGPTNELWELTLSGSPLWRQIAFPGTPSPRAYHSMVHDSHRHRILMFGGSPSGGVGKELYALELTGTVHWSPIAAVNGALPALYASDLSFDAVRDRVLITSANLDYPPPAMWAVTFKHEVTVLDLAPKNGLQPTMGRYVSSVYDPATDALYVIDGNCCNSDHGTFRLRFSQAPDVAIEPLGHGQVTASAVPCDTSGTLVTLTVTPEPTYVLDHWSGDATGSSHPLTVTVDGYKQITAHLRRQSAPDMCGRWTFQYPTGAPAGRTGAYRILDPIRRRVILFGGFGFGNSALNDLWQFSLDTRTWTPLATAGTAPAPRYDGAAVYDTLEDRMLIVGGFGAPAGAIEVWSLSLGGTPVWSKLATSGGLTNRALAPVIYDPVRHRVTLFGGRGDFGEYNDLWQLSLDAVLGWTQLQPGAGPSVRQGAVGIHDPLRDRMLVFGGETLAYRQEQVFNELWALNLNGAPQWTSVTPHGGLPPARSRATMVHDALRDRLLIHAGASFYGQVLRNDTWAIDLAPEPATTDLTGLVGTGPGARYFVPGVFDPVDDELIVFANSSSGTLDDVYHLPFGITLDVAVSPAGAGMVTRDPAGLCYEQNQQVTVTSTPRDGYSLHHWSGDASGSSNPLTIAMTGNKSIVAHFVQIGSPAIRSFHPTSGAPLTAITIVGGSFTGSSEVRFNGLSATFVVVSDSVIVAHVPELATDGPISVVTPQGAATTQDSFDVLAQGSINLSWDDCGVTGTDVKTWACDTEAGEPFRMFASFFPPDGMGHFIGLSGQIDFRSSDALPDWWKIGAGQCRPLGFQSSADFTGGPATCTDVFAGTATSAHTYDVSFGSPNRARFRFQAALPTGVTVALSSALEYYAFRIDVLRNRAVGGSACVGCGIPLCIVLNDIQLFQRPQDLYDPSLVDPKDRNYVAWQSAPAGCPATTGVSATVITADATADGVLVEWYSTAIRAATVQRRESDGPWVDLAAVTADGAHRLRYNDTRVVPGAVHGYRLAVEDAGLLRYVGETRIAVPVRMSLAIQGVTWDRDGRGARIALAVPSAAPMTLELFDVSGRRWARQVVTLAQGKHDVLLGAARTIGPGVYFARVTQSGDAVRRRFVVVR